MSARAWFKCFPSDFLNGVSDLSPNELAVYTICLMRMYDESGPIANDHDRIGRRCNMRPTHCRKALDALLKAGKLIAHDGLLFNERARKEIESLHELSTKQASNAHARWDQRAEKPNENNDGPMPSQCQTDAKPMPTRYQKPDTRKKIPPLSPHGFDAFWEAYPLRKARGAAVKAWGKAIMRAPPETIIAAAAAYRPAETKFTKHPATWLNQDCWTDEPDHHDEPDAFARAALAVATGHEYGMAERPANGMGSAPEDVAGGSQGGGRWAGNIAALPRARRSG